MKDNVLKKSIPFQDALKKYSLPIIIVLLCTVFTATNPIFICRTTFIRLAPAQHL